MFIQDQQRKNKLGTSSETFLGKRLPANIEAEKSVLGSILINDGGFSQVSEILLPDDFYHQAHKIIFEVMLDLSQKSLRIDLVTLQDELIKREQLEIIGGLVYLISLQEEIPALGLLNNMQKSLKKKQCCVSLLDSATGIITNCYSQNEKEIESVLDDAEKTIFQISNKRSELIFCAT